MPATLLALDLSTAHGSLAVVCGNEVRFEASFQSERSHNARVFAPLQKALAAAGDHVLLSPGFSSLDQFRGYDDRGRQFEELVSNL